MKSVEKLEDILLVEDNPRDVRLTKEIFEGKGLTPTFHVVSDGNDALDFLHQRDEYEDAPTPDIILLDWHLPETNGSEILSMVRNNEDLGDVPVVVQSGSGAEIDVLEEEGYQADAFVMKPPHPDEFLDALEGF